MQINLKKKVFTTKEIKFAVQKLKQAVEKGLITVRSEKNLYLLASYKGVEEKGLSPKWNVKIYRYSKKKKGHSIVCVDMLVLDRLLNEDYDHFIPPELRVLRIDDAGWGFPLCGVMVGVSDEKKVHTATVPVEYFRDDTVNNFETRRYLVRYADFAIQLMGQFDADPATHRVEICTGYINQPLREKLRDLGYDVRVVEIKGLLQEQLEQRFKEYVNRDIGADIYYDPKDMEKSEIPERYRECLEYGKTHCPEKIKTGWKVLGG